MYVCPECGEGYAELGFCTRDGIQVADTDGDPVLGQTIGAYRVARLIGLGGMGRVYKGVNPSIGSRVAIKVLSRDCAEDQELVDRFFAEAKAVNVIRHESIVNILNLDRLPDRRPFIIMEYLDGKPLSKVISDRGPLPLGTFARIVGETLSALGAAHAAGIIHRDLKPDNIFVTPHGRAKVLDFGIAKLTGEVAGVSARTRDGSLMGTPHYMAPEQAQAKTVDPRTDIYSMGVILFEGLTGRQPFEADALYDLLRMHVEATPPPPSALRGGIPPEYEALILRALSKDPNDRQQSAKQLYRELVEATRHLDETAWEPIGEQENRMSVGMSAIPTPAGPPTPSAQHEYHIGGQTPQPARVGPAPSDAPPAGQPYPQQPTPTASGQVYQPLQSATPTSKPSRGPLYAAAAACTVLAIVAGVLIAVGGGDDEKGQQPVAGAGGSGSGSQVAEAVDAGASGNTGNTGNTGNVQVGNNVQVGSNVTGSTVILPTPNGPFQMPAAMNTIGTADWPMNDQFMGYRSTPNVDAVDVSGFITKATELAKKAFPDAVLARIDSQGVRTNGLADLTLSDNLFVIYHFVSPSKAVRPADLPIGVEHNPVCTFTVMLRKDMMNYNTASGWCDRVAVNKPRCSAKEVWRRAIAEGAPSGNVVGSLSYWAEKDTGKPRWAFMIGNKHHKWIADDC